MPNNAGAARRSRAWGRESGDYIKNCDGACIHAIGSLAGAYGWVITQSLWLEHNQCRSLFHSRPRIVWELSSPTNFVGARP
jgi:hypothetical protein